MTDFPFDYLLTSDQKIKLNNNSAIIKYRKKDIIVSQNSKTTHIIYLKSGLIKIFKEGKNKKLILIKLATPGTLIGLSSVAGENLYHYSASAITDVEVYQSDLDVFKNIISENGKFALQLMNLLSLEGLFILEKLSTQINKQLPGRLADVLLYFSEEIFKSDVFAIPLTRKELADFAGTTKESFIRTLTEFKNDKIINIEGPLIRIISMDIVKTLSALG